MASLSAVLLLAGCAAAAPEPVRLPTEALAPRVEAAAAPSIGAVAAQAALVAPEPAAAVEGVITHDDVRAALWGSDGAAPPKDIFDGVGLTPKPGQTIVYAPPFFDFIGDSLLFGLGNIDALHRRFPDSKIRVLTPFAPMLRPQPWLEPIAMTREEFKRGDASAHVGNDGFLLYVEHGILDEPWRASEKGLAARGLDGLGYTLIVPDAQSSNPQPHTLAEVTVTQAGTARIRKSYVPVALAGIETMYQRADAISRLLFGNDRGFALPKELFVDPAAEAYVQAHRDGILPGGAAARFSIVNLNTKADWKLDLARYGYVRALEDLVDMALAHDPGSNVLVTAPEEEHMGPEAAAKAREAVAKRAGRVAFMPADKALWLPLLERARFVLTQDSGFTHVALIVQPPEKVFTFSRHSLPGYWRKPNQPFYLTPKENRLVLPDLGLYDAVKRWLKAL